MSSENKGLSKSVVIANPEKASSEGGFTEVRKIEAGDGVVCMQTPSWGNRGCINC